MRRIYLHTFLIVLCSSICIAIGGTVFFCSSTPGFHGLQLKDTEDSILEGFVVARPEEILPDAKVRLKVLRWLGPDRTDSTIILNHTPEQTSLSKFPSLSPSCSEVIAENYQYLIPLYRDSEGIQFPIYLLVLGRIPDSTDTVRFDSTALNILEYVYKERKLPYRISMNSIDTVYDRFSPTEVRVTVENVSNYSLPFPVLNGFDLRIMGLRNTQTVFYLYGYVSGNNRYESSFLLDPNGDYEVIPSQSSIEKTVDLNVIHPTLKDVLPTDITNLKILATINVAFIQISQDTYLGTGSISDTVSMSIGTPTFTEKNEPISIVRISPNYPNPFNPSTMIEFGLPEREFVSLKIYDVLGNEIETLVDEQLTSGTYRVNWNAAARAAGVYFYRLQAGAFVETRKLVLLK
ncbi:MAG TPA: T9SS type A sorting domain-containing protein [Bacteroidota bacterium]